MDVGPAGVGENGLASAVVQGKQPETEDKLAAIQKKNDDLLAAANLTRRAFGARTKGGACSRWRSRRFYQCLAALRYTNQRYGTPLAAWDFWKDHHCW
ncbi:MAG: hypothetical protein HOV71_16090 [Hamadaea sp.]|nr:hypothetical protein [Hamadaea sp.]NUR49650.1 hypothetical protein [Hamadaea sp.]NUT08266.1 hypothetical protein [Hamadaea sp.]